jgi:signal peptidase II
VCRVVTLWLLDRSPQSVLENPAIAFSIPMPYSVIMIIWSLIVVALCAICFWLIAQKKFWLATGCMLLVAGAASNLADRIRYGAVMDYLHLPYLSTANIADIIICIGVSVLALTFLCNPHTYDRSTQNRDHRRN